MQGAALAAPTLDMLIYLNPKRLLIIDSRELSQEFIIQWLEAIEKGADDVK